MSLVVPQLPPGEARKLHSEVGDLRSSMMWRELEAWRIRLVVGTVVLLTAVYAVGAVLLDAMRS